MAKTSRKDSPGNIAAQLAACPKVRVIFLSGSQAHEKTPVSFSFMGKVYSAIKRNKPIDLPRPVVQHLQGCQERGLVYDEVENKYSRVSSPSYPMQVLLDPVPQEKDAEVEDAAPAAGTGGEA